MKRNKQITKFKTKLFMEENKFLYMREKIKTKNEDREEKEKKEKKSFEIERSFLIEELPEGVEKNPYEIIRQGYITEPEDSVDARVRENIKEVDGKEKKTFCLTIKQGEGIKREEKNVPLSEEQFNELWKLIEERRIEKKRYKIKDEKGNVLEVNIFKGNLEGLITVEVEFLSEEEAEKFDPPDWFGKEVTDERGYKNKSLAKYGLPEEEIKEKKKEELEYGIEEWKEEITKRVLKKLEKQDKVIINLSGPSASGKGEAVKQLKKRIQKEKIDGQDIKILALSTDDFYKGISRMIMEKVLIKNPEIQSDPDELSKTVKEIIYKDDFSDKFNIQNLEKIISYLEKNNANINPEKIKEDIQEEFSHIDFDNPEAVDLKKLSNIIKRIKADEKAEVPEYDMSYGESIKSKSVKGKNYNVILIEGIYGLNNEILKYSDIKSFVETDNRTLLMRRLRRDVGEKGRTSFTPEFSLRFLLTTVIPAYEKHILPDRKNANVILKNDYTFFEMYNVKKFDIQDKIPISKDELGTLVSKWGEPLKEVIQEDFYFANKGEGHNPEHLLRVRLENGELKDLVHKGPRIDREKDEKVIRPAEEYISEGGFGEHYTDIAKIKEDFETGDFEFIRTIRKKRRIYKLNGIEIAVDEIDGLGDFLELKTKDQTTKSPAIDRFKQEYGLLDKRNVGPYIDEFLEKEKG